MMAVSFMEEEVIGTVHHVLEQDPSMLTPEDERIFTKVQASYVSCMDIPMLERLGLQPLEELVGRIKSLSSDHGGSSSQQKFISSLEHRLTDEFLFLLNSGIDAMLQLEIQADDKDPGKQIISVGPVFVLGRQPPSFYGDSKYLEEYKDIVSKILAHFYHGSQEIKADVADGVITLERRIAEATPSFAELWDVNKSYNKLDLVEVEKMLPELSIASIARVLSPETAEIQFVLVRSPSYLRSLSRILRSTPSNIIENYFVWKVIQGYAPRVEHPLLQPLKRFQNLLLGRTGNVTEERWKRCLRDVEDELPWIISRFYVLEKFAQDRKVFATQVITDVQMEFVTLLGNATWMAFKDRLQAQKKARIAVVKIGYPTQNPDVLDSLSLEGYYSALNTSNATYAENKARASFFHTQLKWSKLGKSTPREDFRISSTAVTAYYMPNLNELGFTAGILQAPWLFDHTLPAYLSYGSLGSTAGHELSHGFDPSGSQYDYNGRLGDWWSSSTRDAFNQKALCFVDQYNNYSIPHFHGKYYVNGSLTQGENIADAGGLRAAFSAWIRRERESPGEILPGLEFFTKEQMFFVANGRSWCSKASGKELYRRMQSNAHAPEQVRLAGSIDNSLEFKNAFQCPDRTPSCKLW
jgi:endothelin-converting enzyme